MVRTKMHESLPGAYEATDFWVDDAPAGPFSIRCGERSPTLDRLLSDAGLEDWAYITACNPGSRPLTDEENASHMRKLETQLQALGCTIYHGRGVGKGGDWPPEPSLLVLGLGEEEGLEFARTFGQNAIVVGTRGERARLAWAASGPDDRPEIHGETLFSPEISHVVAISGDPHKSLKHACSSGESGWIPSAIRGNCSYVECRRR
jgi:Protein of unknown function (DUF3293)